MYKEKEVTENLLLFMRYPKRHIMKNFRSKHCPLCSAPLNVALLEILRYDNGTLWITIEEWCENEKCPYDKIQEIKFWPDYTGLIVKKV